MAHSYPFENRSGGVEHVRQPPIVAEMQRHGAELGMGLGGVQHPLYYRPDPDMPPALYYQPEPDTRSSMGRGDAS